MDKYYFDFGFCMAVLIALIGSMALIIYAMIDNFYLRRELHEAYLEIEKLQPPFQVVELSTKWGRRYRACRFTCDINHYD